MRRGTLRAVARTALLGVLVLTGLLAPFAQAGIGAVDAAPFGVAQAAGPGGQPGTTYGANTLAQFRASGNAWGQTPPTHTPDYNPPLPAPAHATGKSAAQQVTASGTATTTAYVGDIEEVAISGASTTTTTYYYAVRQRIALAVNGTLSYLASDGLGSANVAFDANGNPTATALYRPYGTMRYASGQMPGSDGFTGQHSDAAVTRLDYYGARYYDPAGAVFTQPDSIGDGPNPYAYTGGNPETFSDPSGHKRTDGQPGGHDYWTPQMLYAYLYDKAMDGALGADGNSMALWLFLTDKLLYSEIVEREGETYGTINFQTMMVQDAWKVNNAHTGNYWNEADHRQERMALEPALFMAAEMASGRSDDLAPGMSSMGDPDGAGIFPDVGGFDGVDEGDDVAVNRATDGMDGEACSFSADTPVATPTGERAIGSLTVGETVEAYNPRTGQTEAEPVQHVWVNHDSDLVDVRVAASETTTMTRTQASGHGMVVGDSTRAAVHLSRNQQTANADAGETIHTTANHPWLTADRGFVAAGELRPGEPLVTLGGASGIVLWVRVTPGVADRYNLTVAHDHTYAVGAGLWVVHNCNLPDLSEEQIKNGLGQAAEARGKAAAGAVAKASGSDAVLGTGASGKPGTGPFAPGVQGPYNPAKGIGVCAEFYCSSDVGAYDGSLDVFVDQVNGKGPCEACASTFQQWANANGSPIRVYWSKAGGSYGMHVWTPTP